MWFDDNENMSSKWLFRKKKRGRKAALNVNVRLGGRSKAERYRIAAYVLTPLIVAVVVLLLWLGVSQAGELLFSGNKRFTIKHLIIRQGPVISEELVEEFTGISEGTNLFGFNIQEVRHKFLERVPNAESMEISRRLPDTLKIEISERVPLARVGRMGHLVVDGGGYLFILRRKLRELPIIRGYDVGNQRPGQRVDGRVLTAVKVLNVCSHPKIDLRVAEINVGDDERIYVQLCSGKRGSWLWDDIGDITEQPRVNLFKKLSGWSEVLKTPKGKQDTEFDLSFNDKVYSR
ncbi:cell division protein FtsQ/DivIB [Verrucomicrobiota bacterium]